MISRNASLKKLDSVLDWYIFNTRIKSIFGGRKIDGKDIFLLISGNYRLTGNSALLDILVSDAIGSSLDISLYSEMVSDEYQILGFNYLKLIRDGLTIPGLSDLMEEVTTFMGPDVLLKDSLSSTMKFAALMPTVTPIFLMLLTKCLPEDHRKEFLKLLRTDNKKDVYMTDIFAMNCDNFILTIKNFIKISNIKVTEQVLITKDRRIQHGQKNLTASGASAKENLYNRCGVL